MEKPQKVKKTEDRPAYMREYMKKKYNENPAFWKHYKNVLRIKKTHQPTDREVELFYDNLMDYCIIKRIKEGTLQEKWEQMVYSLQTTPCRQPSLAVLANDSVGVSDCSTDANISSL